MGVIIKMEVCIKNEGNKRPQIDKKKELYTTKEKMEQMGVSLKQVANYLIQLFYKTGQKYTCTQTKIGKLLSILAFLYARKNQILFDETIYRYKDCGAVTDNLKLAMMDRDAYIQSSYFDFEGIIVDNIDDSLFDSLDDSLNKYREVNELSDELKADIEKVFRNFGAYSAYSIGQLINTIVNHDNVVGYNETIDLAIIAKMDKHDFEQPNTLIEFLFQ